MSTLEIDETRGLWHVVWCDDGEYGAVIGQSLGDYDLPALRTKLAACRSKDEREYLAVELAAREFAARDASSFAGSRPQYEPSIGGYGFEELADARALLRVCKDAKKRAHENVPMPEWARTAIAEGWKPPKGWKP